MKQKIAFIHIPKTGGTSIEKALGMMKGNYKKSFFSRFTCYPGTGIFPQHFTYSELKQYVKDLDTYFCFTFVRNPYDRLYSAWCYRNKPEKNLTYFLRWIKQELGDNPALGFNHFRPQTDFVDPHIDFTGKYETLEKDFDRLKAFLPRHFHRKKLPHTMKNRFRHEQSYIRHFDDQAKSIVQELYKNDFMMFHYLM